MKLKLIFFIVFIIGIGLVLSGSIEAAGLNSRINEAFSAVFGRNPTATENLYWTTRTVDRKSFAALQDTMRFYKSQNKTVGAAAKDSRSISQAVRASTKQQLIRDVLPLFVQIYGKDPSNADKIWWRKRISCDEIKDKKQLESSMRFHKNKGVSKGANTICGQKATTPSGVTARSVTGFSDHPLGDTVRVGIYNAGSKPVVIAASGRYQVREGSDTKATLSEGDAVTITYSGGLYHVRGAVEIEATEPIRLVPVGGTIMQVKSYNDPSATIPGKNYNRFRDTIVVTKCTNCSDVWVVNDVRAEHYAKGLAETSASDAGATEFYKALAIAARSYALYHRNVTGGRRPAKGYDIGRTADDQIYRGYEYEILVPRLASAVDQTRGVIVTDKDGDKPLITTYFSDSGGKTKTAQEVWGTTASRFSHLQKNVDDPHHVAATCRGHCVGMSAQGAFGFAKKDGWSFQRILQHYYQNIRLVKAY